MNDPSTPHVSVDLDRSYKVLTDDDGYCYMVITIIKIENRGHKSRAE